MPACTWKSRVWLEFSARNLTRAERDVMLTLHTYRGVGGVAWPSHATLAARTCTSPRTVQRALDAGRKLGLVRSTARRRRAGWRWLRTSDMHRLTLPTAPVTAGQCPRFRALRSTRQNGEEGESEKSKGIDRGWLEAAAAGPDLLAARRRALEEQMRDRLARRTEEK